METGEGNRSNGDPGEIASKIRDHVDREKAPSILYETECCIFRVPKLLREAKEDAYTPKVVSIGPYHRKDERLHPMERFKVEYLDFFLDLSRGDEEEDSISGLWRGDEDEDSISNFSMELKDKSKLLLVSCVKKILEKEDQIRGSYADHINLSRDDFIQMVLLDSVFIIWYIVTLPKLQPSANDPQLSQNMVIKSAVDRVKLAQNEIRRDLLLLENQLPLFIIGEIYKIRYPALPGTANTTFGYLVAEFLNIKLPPNWTSFGNILALMRKSYVRRFQNRPNEELNKSPEILSPTASHLHAAGVKFKTRDPTYENDFLEIQFDKHKGVLSIPKVNCTDQTQSMFRNMIAMEQCMYLYKEPTYITDYFYFLDCLISTKGDVQLLAEQGIVKNFMGPGFVCDTFNTISYNTWTLENTYAYGELRNELNHHCSKKWNSWKATLRNKYFSKPWAGISVIYALILLLLTIGQVILAILVLPGIF